MRRLEHETGSTPNLEKLAEDTGLTEREVSEGLEALQNQLCLSLDAITENISSYQKNPLENEPYKSAEFKELVDRLASLIDDLTPREKLVLSLYYGEELNMRETSEVMGITEGRVSQLHSPGLVPVTTEVQGPVQHRAALIHVEARRPERRPKQRSGQGAGRRSEGRTILEGWEEEERDHGCQ